MPLWAEFRAGGMLHGGERRNLALFRCTQLVLYPR